MVKSVIKELILLLLLCLAVILILGILLYRYVPMAKTLPNEVAYTIPAEAKEELANSAHIDESQIIMTYSVNASDLNNYQKIKDYKPGKANPFAGTVVQSGNNGNAGNNTNSGTSTNANTTNSNSSNTNTSNSNSSNEQSNSNESQSGGTYFQNTGTK